MKVYKTQDIRNVAVLGHGGCGKTTLVEAMANVTGVTSRMGKVVDGNTISDYDKEEIKRKFSISTSIVPIEWRFWKINLLDTPRKCQLAVAGIPHKFIPFFFPVDTVLDTLAYNNLILDQVYFYHCLILLLHFCISRFSDGRQRCDQSMNIQRLSQMACHPCRKTLVHIRFGNIRCHGYDRYRIPMVLIHFAEHLCRFQTIRFR